MRPESQCQACDAWTDDLIQDDLTNLQICPDCFFKDCDDAKDLELSVLFPGKER